MLLQRTQKAAYDLQTRKRPFKYRQARDKLMAAYVRDILDLCGGDKEKAAKKLRISYSSMKEKVRPDFGR